MDLLHRLPAELRNRIYELALSTEEYTEGKKTITIRQCSCLRFFDEEEPPWQEPALLRAAKWIRSEAKLIYFDSARIDICLTATSEIEPLCAWLQSIATGDQNTWLSTVVVCLRSGKWTVTMASRPLARLFRHYNLDLEPEDLPQKGGWRSMHFNSCMVSGEIRRRMLAIEQSIRVGMAAKEQNRSKAELETVLEEFMQALRMSMGVKPQNAGLEGDEIIADLRYLFRGG
ncbi:hypothetical protein LTR74_006339 [Friedmanniomyces endolithicus]|nr:hypothetical protein LTR74_006339 [Friedmanniomyces endolithicus]